MSDGVSEKSEREEDLLNKFKEQVQSYLRPEKFIHQDHYLKKWLIARKWDVEKAVAMFIESEQFKKQMNVDSLLDWKPPQVLKDNYCGGVIGLDKLGNPLKFAASNMDMKGLLYSVRRQDLIKLKLQECEHVVKIWEEESKKQGRFVDKMTVIFDQDHAKEMLWGPARDLNLYFVKMLENNYPEMLGKMFIINAPIVFPILWKFVMPFLAEETKNKIHILGNSYQTALLEHIDEQYIPASHGGTLVDEDGDPMCTKIIGPQGTKIPEEFYLKDHYLEGHDKLNTLEVLAGSRNSVPVQISAPGTFIKWEFVTKSNDIAFGIEFVEADGKRRNISPLMRVNSHIAPEDGAFLCTEAGTYSLVFDNSFSWTRSKTVRYKVEVICQDDHEKKVIKTDIAKMSQSESAANITQF